MKKLNLVLILLCVLLVAACSKSNEKSAASQQALADTAHAATAPANTTSADTASTDIPTVQPAELADLLSKPGDKPLLLHVGFDKLYQQAHIPGSEYLGPTSEKEAVARLEQRVTDTPRSTAIIVYCGCCPWERCPNVKPAYEALHDMGFTNLKVLFITKDFGTDWASHGYPVAANE